MDWSKVRDVNPLKKKFRWTIKIFDESGLQVDPERFVKIKARPNLVIEETEIDFLSKKTWIPGKTSWELVTIRALAGTHEEINELEANLPYIKKAELRLYDGCGQVLETWILNEITAGTSTKVLYRDSDEADLEMEFRYKKYEYKPGDYYNAPH